MYKIILALFIFVGLSECNAQTELFQTILNNHIPFSEKQKIAREYFHCEMEDSVDVIHGDSDDEYSEYKRWEWMAKKFVMPDGYLSDPFHDYNIRKNVLNKNRSTGTWEPIGQTDLSYTPSGIGRVDAIGCHPTDTNILYIGTFCGGIWKTTDGGNSWVALGDNLPICSVGNICVDPINPDIVYITLGFNLENNAGLGIYKSTDAGLTWNPTGQTSSIAAQIVYKKLLIHPSNPNILYSCQSDGLWKTTDAGATWSLINLYSFTYLFFNPLNSNSMYACGSGFGTSPGQVFKSTDEGNTFNQLTFFSNEIFLKIGITKADTNYIAVRTTQGSTFRFYLSTNNGINFNLQNGNNTIDNGGEVIITATDKNKIYCGFPYLHQSIDGGISWQYFASNIHADIRGVSLSPVTDDIIYFCNDGGINKLNITTGTMTNMSNTLHITMFYDISLSRQDSITLIGGTQDNGSRVKKNNGSWSVVTGGDGMTTAINPTDDQTMYASTQYGNLYRTRDQWQTQNYITPTGSVGAWTTPFMLNPSNPKTIFAGYHDVLKSVDEGTTWDTISNLSPFSFSGKLEFLDVAKTDSNYIYCSNRYYNEIFYTGNGGISWYNISSPVSLSNYISGLKIDPTNENRIFILKDGYVNHNKILTTSDHGITWKNISYDLPNVPVFCLTIDAVSDSTKLTFYLGTSIGVYYKNDLDTTWTYLGNGLPNTFVSDLEIHYGYNKLVAATFGYGIWQIDLPDTNVPTSIATVQNKNEIRLLENLIDDELKFESKMKANVLLDFFIYDTFGKIVFKQNRISIQGSGKFSISIPSLANGNYFVQAESESFSKMFKIVVVK